jgi:hypothetical protein
MRRSPANPREVALLALVVLAVALPLAGATGHGIDHLAADPQVSADGVVRMESVFATEDGFVVLYRDDGDGERVVASRPFGASARDVFDVPVRIPADAWTDLPANATLRAALHGDDGDGTFDPATDPPLASFGGAADDSFVVRRGGTAYVGASSGASVQRSADGTVEVRSVHMPEQGYLVLRTSSGGAPAEVVGATALDAGGHANVSVALDDAFFAARPANATFSLWALAYADDGNGTFDGGDRPVRVGEEPVGTRFGVQKVLPGRTPTPTPDEGSIVVTDSPTDPPSTPTTTATAPTDTPTAAPPATRSPSPTATPPPGTGGAGPGFAPAAALVALAAIALLALGRS